MPKIILINPTLLTSLDLVVKLMSSVHGDHGGRLLPYEIYSLSDKNGTTTSYSLTLPVIQFLSNFDPANPGSPQKRLDIYEPFVEANGEYGSILPVIKSIIFIDGQPVFDTQQYVIKEILADQKRPSNKPGKPNIFVRAARREHYLASQLPHLGVDYQLVEEATSSFLHMKRMPGAPLSAYVGKISTRQFLSLAYALLTEIPAQIHQQIQQGKRAGNTIVHCDLKAENILAMPKADDEWMVNVIDLGMAKPMNTNTRQYISRFGRGNWLGYDKDRLDDILNKTFITYDAASDLYALFLAILEFGDLKRFKLKNIEALHRDCAEPNLEGLFTNMRMGADTRAILISLAQRILDPNKANRPSAAEAAQIFKKELEKPCTGANLPSPKVYKKVSAQDLARLMRADLDSAIDNAQSTNQKLTVLKEWIALYREHAIAIDPSEWAQYHELMENTTVTSRLIRYFAKFKLNAEYDDNGCARLLSRHHQLTKDLYNLSSLPEHLSNERYELSPLPKHWQSRFIAMLDELPLQVTAHDEHFCAQLQKYVDNLIMLRKIDYKDRNEPALFSFLKEKILSDMEQSDFKHWCANLPQDISLFNQQCDVFFNLIRLLDKLHPVYRRLQLPEENLEEWGNDLSEQAITGFSQSIVEAIEIRNVMASLLESLPFFSSAIKKLGKYYRGLNDSIYDEDLINETLTQLELGDTKQVIGLNTRLQILTFFAATFNQLTSKTFCLQRYPQVSGIVQNTLTNLIAQCITTGRPENMPNQMQQIEQLIISLTELDQFINSLRNTMTYPNIVASLTKLAADPDLILKLVPILTQQVTPTMKVLDEQLKQILSGSSANTLELLFAEINRYYAYPERYSAISVTRNRNTIFQSVSQSPIGFEEAYFNDNSDSDAVMEEPQIGESTSRG